MHEVLLTILHEYCHNSQSGGSHNHDVTFYKMYHDLSIHNQARVDKVLVDANDAQVVGSSLVKVKVRAKAKT